MIAEVVLSLPIDRLFDYDIPESLLGKVLPGKRVVVSFARRSRVIGIVRRLKEKGSFSALKPIGSVMDEMPLMGEKDFTLAEWMAQQTVCSIGEAVFNVFPLKPQDHFIGSDLPQRLSVASSPESLSLSAEENKLVEQIQKTPLSHPSVFLLLGEWAVRRRIYIKVIAEALSKNKNIIILVPEMNQARSLQDSLREHFDSYVGVWHGGMRSSERKRVFSDILNGHIKIIIGPRSALFSGMNPGLIIVDEEQDHSYKSESRPRYHARDVSVEMGRLHDATVLLGSFSPSLEAYYKTREGRWKILQKVDVFQNQHFPRMTLVGMKSRTFRGYVSEPLKIGITDRLSRKEKVVLYLNRRGYASAVVCPDCGWMARCPSCGVSLVLHQGEKEKNGKSFSSQKSQSSVLSRDWKTKETLHCHYCGHWESFPKRCASCRAASLRRRGTGTQRLEASVAKLFPEAKVARMDRDVIRGKNDIDETGIPQSFHHANVIVGTRKVLQAVGMKDVTLVGVVGIDQDLTRPDFRASEKTFQSVLQMAERFHEKSEVPEVIVQSEHTDHYALRLAASLNYEEFAREELAFRQEMNYPPYVRLAQILVSGSECERVRSEAEKIVVWLEKELPSKDICLGPVPAMVAKKGGNFRWQILVKFSSDQTLSVLRQLMPSNSSSLTVSKKTRILVDVDPVEMR